MNITTHARAIGVDLTKGDLSGTIDEKHVLDALVDLAEGDPENRDLFDEAAQRVRRSRSAGVEELLAHSMLTRPGGETRTQLRYRSEMAAIFTDLAIDVGLRHQRKLLPAG